MELSQEFLIDMAMNAGGYLFAGIISVLLFSIFQKKKNKIELDEIVEEVIIEQKITDLNNLHQTTAKRNVEFITFGKEQSRTPNIVPQTQKIVEQPEQNNGRMNRKEAINLAKKMLVAGATQEKIKRVLPVSDSELALLSLNIR